MVTKNPKIRIIKAQGLHFPAILSLIDELAAFEKLSPPDKSAKKRLLKDAFGRKRAYNLLAAKAGNRIVGYAFYFFTYSSFLAKKTFYLEDIYISKDTRRLGIGKLFFKEFIRIAKKNNCGRMEWCVLDWNKSAIKFYDKLGAKPLKNWIYYRQTL